jgi:hypothetical protein
MGPPKYCYPLGISSESFDIVANPFYGESLIKESRILRNARRRKAGKAKYVYAVACHG